MLKSSELIMHSLQSGNENILVSTIFKLNGEYTYTCMAIYVLEGKGQVSYTTRQYS